MATNEFTKYIYDLYNNCKEHGVTEELRSVAFSFFEKLKFMEENNISPGTVDRSYHMALSLATNIKADLYNGTNLHRLSIVT